MFPTAPLPSMCAACRELGTLEVGQEVRDGRLGWFERFSCRCGHGFEAQGWGLPTPAGRAALLARAGTAELWVDAEAMRPLVSALLVAAVGWSESEAAARLGAMPALAYEGTHAEVAFLLTALESQGGTARVVHRVADAQFT